MAADGLGPCLIKGPDNSFPISKLRVVRLAFLCKLFFCLGTLAAKSRGMGVGLWPRGCVGTLEVQSLFQIPCTTWPSHSRFVLKDDLGLI